MLLPSTVALSLLHCIILLCCFCHCCWFGGVDIPSSVIAVTVVSVSVFVDFLGWFLGSSYQRNTTVSSHFISFFLSLLFFFNELLVYTFHQVTSCVFFLIPLSQCFIWFETISPLSLILSIPQDIPVILAGWCSGYPCWSVLMCLFYFNVQRCPWWSCSSSGCPHESGKDTLIIYVATFLIAAKDVHGTFAVHFY